MPLSQIEREDLNRRLELLADDEKTYMHLVAKEIWKILGCTRRELEQAMLDTITPSPREVRENTMLDLHIKGLRCHEIAEEMGMSDDAVRNLAHRMGVTLNRIHSGQRVPWTEKDDDILIRYCTEGHIPSLKQLYKKLGRNRGSVEYRLAYLRRRGRVPHDFKPRARTKKAEIEVIQL